MSQNWPWISWLWLLLMSVFASESHFQIWPYSSQKDMFNHVVLKKKRKGFCILCEYRNGIFFPDVCRKWQGIFLLIIDVLKLCQIVVLDF